MEDYMDALLGTLAHLKTVPFNAHKVAMPDNAPNGFYPIVRFPSEEVPATHFGSARKSFDAAVKEAEYQASYEAGSEWCVRNATGTTVARSKS